MQRETLVNGDMSHPASSNPTTHSHPHPNNYPMLLAAQQQLYDYALRLRFAAAAAAATGSTSTTNNTSAVVSTLPPPATNSNALAPHPSFVDPHSIFAFHQRHDPRLRCLLREEPKPSYSYIGLIAMAILSSPERKLVLSDIYQWILDHYAYFRARGPGWRNSIRHNLSLNDCFIKAGRSANGKGHYWSIHPANLADFSSGDFRRRRAQRRVRKSMGLSVPDDDDDDDDILPTNSNDHHHHFDNPLSKYSGSDELRANVADLSHSSSSSSSTTTTTAPAPGALPPTTTTTTSMTGNSTNSTPNLLQRYFDDMQRVVTSRFDHHHHHHQQQQQHGGSATPGQLFFPSPPSSLNTSRATTTSNSSSSAVTSTPLRPLTSIQNPRKRCFDVDSLLAPEQPCLIKRHKSNYDVHDDHLCSPDSKSDGSTDTDISA